MKVTLLVVLFVFIVNTISAQYQKNDLKVSLYFAPLLANSAEAKSLGNASGIILRPSFGYYISNTSSVELNFTYGLQRNIEINTIDSEYQSFVIVPNYRNTIINKEKLSVFAEAGVGLGAIKYYAIADNSNTDTHRELSGGVFVYNIGVGAAYFFSKNISVELVLPYISTNNITSSFFRNLFSGFGPSIGFSLKL